MDFSTPWEKMANTVLQAKYVHPAKYVHLAKYVHNYAKYLHLLCFY